MRQKVQDAFKNAEPHRNRLDLSPVSENGNIENIQTSIRVHMARHYPGMGAHIHKVWIYANTITQPRFAVT